ncbi:hypothetical protein CPB85DRAFT_161249 [Mucidula mucida]|nr:hypothetical protein CPB85DRAFT_161249 [Mucidula mucida]
MRALLPVAHIFRLSRIVITYAAAAIPWRYLILWRRILSCVSTHASVYTPYGSAYLHPDFRLRGIAYTWNSLDRKPIGEWPTPLRSLQRVPFVFLSIGRWVSTIETCHCQEELSIQTLRQRGCCHAYLP